jgi:serine/threonine-protein kinase
MQQTVLNNRYELEHKIGEGGMAVVYRARDVRLNRRVAVKILHEHYANDPDFLNRFQHEAQAAAILTHPSVVNVYDVGQDGALHYIVMEHVEGENLKTLINREAPLPVGRALAIAEAAAYGLESAHRLGMIHRDIKPQNIMVTLDGHIRITDFGIAKSEFSTALTQTGITFGTADYISPEQARGQPATPQSDIYALGVTLYEMLAARRPFSGDSPVSVATQHVSTEPPRLRQYNPNVPPQLEALVMQTLSKDPAQRPASASEFAQMLHYYRDLADQQTVAAGHLPESPAARAGALPPGHPGGAGRGNFPPPRRSKAQAPRNQNQGCGVFIIGLLLLSGVLALVFLLSTGTLGPVAVSPTSTPTSSGAPVADVESTPTPLPGETPSPTPSPSSTATASPTPSPSPSPSPTSLPTVVVPDIRDMPEINARSELIQLRLTPVNDNEPRYDDEVADGSVIDQEVPAGTSVREGDNVTYTLSLGPELVVMPNLVNTPQGFARQRLGELGLAVQVVEQPSRNISEGYVISQNPLPEARMQPQSTVFLTISIGDKVQFPPVVGMQREAAEQQILLSGLNLEYVDVQGRDRLIGFDQYRPNEVVSALANGQPVRNGDYIPRGSTIVLGVRAP